jgi:hypothetical protein
LVKSAVDPLPSFGGHKSSGFVGKVDPRDVQKIQSIMQALSVREEDCDIDNSRDPITNSSDYTDSPPIQPR